MPVKNEQQQACLTLHRMRAQLMKVRVMQTNALRGLFYEFGIVLERLLLRRPYGVVVAALANKLDRTVWAVLVKGKAFDQVKWNPGDLAAA